MTNKIQGIRSERQSAWRTMDRGSWHCTGGSDQDQAQEKEMQKGKMVVWWGLTNSWGKKRSEGKREKEKYTHLNAEFQRIARRDKKAFLSDQCKEKEETIKCERLEISSRILEIPREHFMQRWLSNIPPSVYNTVYLLIYWWAFGYGNSASMNMHVYVFFWVLVFISCWYILKSRITVSYGNSMFNHSRKCQIIFHSSWTSLYFHHWSTRISSSSHLRYSYIFWLRH